MSYTFPTATATATTQTLPVQNDVSGATLTVEFSYHKGFANVASSKSVTGSGKTVTLSLSGTEVDSLKSTYYRIKSVKGGVTSYIVDGSIEYNPQTTHDSQAELKLPTRLSDVNLKASYVSVPHGDLAKNTPRWSPPAQVNPTVYTAANSFLSITAGPNEDVIVYGRPSNPNGSSVQVQGGRHVRFIGGKYAKSGAGSTLNVGQVTGSVSFEGVEIDASGYNGDAINACGITSGTLTYPDVYIQKCRVTGVNGTSGTVHADVFQPQGPMGRLFVDLCSFSSTYQGFFISPQQPIRGVFISRTNFTKLANVSNPITYMLWFNDGTQNPYPAIIDEVYIDGPAGQTIAANLVWPNAGLTGSGASLNGQAIGAVANSDGSASWPTIMQIDGKVYSGPPAAGDFRPAGLGIGYVSKAALSSPPPLTPSISFEDSQGFCYTMQPYLATSAAASSGANRTVFMRLRGSKKSATAVTVLIGTGSGNISVGVYANNGQSGRSAAPGAPKATTGSVVMSTTGNSEQTIPLGSTIDVNEGDWVGISIDNVTATLGRPQANPINPSSLSGLQAVQSAAFPVPTGTPSGTFPSTPFWYAQIT